TFPSGVPRAARTVPRSLRGRPGSTPLGRRREAARIADAPSLSFRGWDARAARGAVVRRPRDRDGGRDDMEDDAPGRAAATGDPLALDADEMRAMGYRVVDLLVDRIARLPSEPVLREGSRDELEARIDGPAPERPVPFDELLDRLDRDVLPFVGHFAHPRFFGYIPGAGTWPGALGDLIASAMNIDSGSWREASGASQLELTVLDWFRAWIGYPPSSAGVLVSGGSAANLAAIACARETLVGAMTPRIVIYTSDQSHSSVARAARHLG